MRERAVVFGGSESLVGVLTERGAGSSENLPGVILLNAGLLPRAGPNRLHVRLARRLAARGLAVLRMDLSGIGDSEPRRDGLPSEEAAVEEAGQAMCFLTSAVGAQRFVLMGLCSGAVNSFRVARQDARVVGAVMIDGYAYRTGGYYLHHYGRRLLSARRWRNLVTGRSESGRQLRQALRLDRGQEEPTRPRYYARTFPPREAILSDIRSMLDREISLYFIYSEMGMEDCYNYEGQFHHMFPGLRGRLRVGFVPGADHTFTLLSHQQKLLRMIEDWVETGLLPR